MRVLGLNFDLSCIGGHKRRNTKPPPLGELLVGHFSLRFDPQYDAILRDYYLYCIKLFADELAKMSGAANIIFGDYQCTFDNPCRTINIGLQVEHTLVKPGGRGSEGFPSGIIPIQQSSGYYLVRVANLDKLNQYDLIIDYSFMNKKNLTLSGFFPDLLKKYIVISPLLYAFQPDIGMARSNDTITFFINPNEPRRKQFLDRLEATGTKSKNVNQVVSGVEELYRNTRILINIRQTNHHDTLEEFRVLPALLCGVIVICEIAPLKEDCGYSEFVLWSELENMPELIRDVQNNYKKYHDLIFGGTDFMRCVEKLMARNAYSVNQAMKIIGLKI